MHANHQADAFDCGDGVPNLHFTREAPATVVHQPFGVATHHNPRPDTTTGPTGPDTGLRPGPVILVLTLLGQIVLLLAVLAGGNPVVGAAAGLALLACGLTVLGLRAVLDAFGRA